MTNTNATIFGGALTITAFILLYIYGPQAAQYNGMQRFMPAKSFSWLPALASSECSGNIDTDNLDFSKFYDTGPTTGVLAGITIGMTIIYFAACCCHAAVLRTDSENVAFGCFVGLVFLMGVAGPGPALFTLGGLPFITTEETINALKELLTCEKTTIWGDKLNACKMLASATSRVQIEGMNKAKCIDKAGIYLKRLIPTGENFAESMVWVALFASMVGLLMLGTTLVSVINDGEKNNPQPTPAGPVQV